MRAIVKGILAAASLTLSTAVALAASLQVSPVLVQVPAPAKTTILKLKNIAATPMTAQVRVYKWVQQDGTDKLIESKDVVASPPMATVKPNGDFVIRLVRLSKAPMAGEESYRLLIDEVPEDSKTSGAAIKFAFRYSIPVFFGLKPDTKPALDWSIENRGGKAVMTIRNTGGRRARLADLNIVSSSGQPVFARGGLLGYVLAGSTASWPLKNSKGLTQGSSVEITALTEDGSLQAKIQVGAAQ